MTAELQKAFAEAAKRPEHEQKLIAARVMADLAEDAFDEAITASGDRLGPLSEAALEEYRTGQTEPLDPERS